MNRKDKIKRRRVMVFGVFDRLHEGHRAFLRQAQKYGDLIVVVARDAVARALKSCAPQQGERTRMGGVRRLADIKHVVLGDKNQGTYAVVARWQPHLICVGYDQKALARDLRKQMERDIIPRIKIVRLKPYRPQRFHSSLLL